VVVANVAQESANAAMLFVNVPVA